MLYYVAPLMFLYAMYGLGRITRQQAAWFVVGTIPTVLLVVLRGTVGVDTPNYLGAIDLLRDADESLQLFEPLFEAFIRMLVQLPIASWAVLALVSLTTTVLLLSGWIRIEPRLVIFTSVFTQFFVDMTMNGIRYGLAFAAIVVGANFLLSKRMHLFWGCVIAATMIQLTSGLLGVLLYVLHEGRFRALVYAVLFGALVMLGFSDHLLLKIAANELEQSPSALSGIVPLLATWSVLWTWAADRQAYQGANRKVWGLFALSLLSYGVTQVTYAGLRTQLLIVFLTSLAFACHLRANNLHLLRRTVTILIAISVIFGALKLRNFAHVAEDAKAPFIPYKFIWEES